MSKLIQRWCGVLRNEKVLLIPEGYDEDSGEYFGFDDEECDISNHYFGFTAENQCWWDTRIGEVDFPEGIKWWVSCEPLLGPIDLWLHAKTVLTDGRIAKNNKPSWLVVGCESGLKRRPCKLEWIESIVEQCRYASEQVMLAYLEYYGEQYRRRTGKTPTAEVLARIHNGGPNGWRKESTLKYWYKVKAVMDAAERKGEMK